MGYGQRLGGIENALPGNLKDTVTPSVLPIGSVLELTALGLIRLTRARHHCRVAGDAPIFASSGHKSLQGDDVPTTESILFLRIQFDVMCRESHDGRSYLKEVRDIRMDLVDDSNAIAQDGCSLARVESGLMMGDDPTISMRKSTGKP